MKRRILKARPLLAAGAGIAAAVFGACGPTPVGNLRPLPACDAGVCLPDGGQIDSGISCYCPNPDAGP